MSKKVKSKAKSLDNTAAISPSQSDMKWESKRDMDLVLDHHEMMQDPERVKRLRKMAGRHNKAIKSLSQLRDVANNFSKTKGLSEDDEAEEKVS